MSLVSIDRRCAMSFIQKGVHREDVLGSHVFCGLQLSNITRISFSASAVCDPLQCWE